MNGKWRMQVVVSSCQVFRRGGVERLSATRDGRMGWRYRRLDWLRQLTVLMKRMLLRKRTHSRHLWVVLSMVALATLKEKVLHQLWGRAGSKSSNKLVLQEVASVWSRLLWEDANASRNRQNKYSKPISKTAKESHSDSKGLVLMIHLKSI